MISPSSPSSRSRPPAFYNPRQSDCDRTDDRARYRPHSGDGVATTIRDDSQPSPLRPPIRSTHTTIATHVLHITTVPSVVIADEDDEYDHPRDNRDLVDDDEKKKDVPAVGPVGWTEILPFIRIDAVLIC